MSTSVRDRQFLDPAVLARLGTLELKARTIVEGLLTGLHRSPFKGFSVEFAEYRQYMPGDDLSTVDWKVYARTDRHYIKKFEEETNLDCHLMLDVSASMGYGAHGITKLEYGQYLAASLAFLINRQRDAAGLTAFDDRIISMMPASARPGHLHAILVTLDRLRLGQSTNVSKPLHQLADSLSKRGMVVLISDLLDDPEQVIRGLRHFRFRGTDVVVFHVLDPDEIDFPFDRATRFEDLESREEVLAVPALVTEHYKREMDSLLTRYKRELGGAGIDYHLLRTDQPLELALMAYLFDPRPVVLMALLSPLFLLGALSAAVPIVVHLLKRHPEAVVKFSAVRLLRHAPVEHASRRHLRELLLLALRVAALLLFAVAFARPYFTASADEGGSGLVVALDTSFSMSGAGRFEKAQALAIDAIDRAEAGTAIAVLTFNDVAQVTSAMSADRALARAAVRAAQPSAGATRYRGAVATAAELLRGRAGRLLVVTDLQGGGWDATERASWPSSLVIDVADIGTAPSNLAVTSAVATSDRIVATVRNLSTAPVDANVHLMAGASTDAQQSTPAGDLKVPIDAMQSVEVRFPRPAGRWAAVRVDDGPGPAADNARYVVFDEASRPVVLLVTATGDLNHDAFYMQQALTAAGQDGAAYDAAGVAGSALSSWTEARLDAHAAVVLASTRGLDHRGRELLSRFLQNGGGMLVTAEADVDGDVVAEMLGGSRVSLTPPDAGQPREERALSSIDARHPVLRPFTGQASLGLASFRRITTMRAAGCPTLASFTGGQAALVECETGRGRVLLFASDLNNRGNDFPLHSTFLPFVHETVRYLAGHRRSTEWLVANVPADVAAMPGVALLPPTAGGDGVLVAVNADPAESEPRRLTVQEFQSAIARVPPEPMAAPRLVGEAQESRQHMWQYVLAAVLLVLLAESVVSMRAA